METPTITTGPTSEDQRTARYNGIVSSAKIRASKVGIAGVGSIGRNIALQLTQFGVGHIMLADPDTIELVNLGTQGWHENDIGRDKVVACEQELLRLRPTVEVETFKDRLPSPECPPIKWGDVLFLTTDTMSSRREILFSMMDLSPFSKPKIVIDLRMLGEVFQAYSFIPTRDNLLTYLKENIFDDDEAVPGTCSTRTTGYAATCAASVATTLFSKFLRGQELPPRVDCDLFSLSMSPATP
jgi:molybdopterin/thiamine biosynthesis adenylyltransferase